jgi:hypothetical protein
MYIFSVIKNARGMAGSGKAVWRSAKFPTFIGSYWWETRGTRGSRKCQWILKKLETKTLRLSQSVPLNGREEIVPYFLLEIKLFQLARISWKFIRGDIQSARKKEFSITGCTEPKEF